MSAWRRFLAVVAVGLSLLAYLALAYATPRQEFGQLLGLFAIAMAGYLVLVKVRVSLRTGLLVALLFRLAWLPATPALSDDFHRFRWDGLLAANAVSPFEFKPNELIAAQDSAAPPIPFSTELASELRAIFPLLNSPNYYSVYPPVSQLVFAAGAALFPSSQLGFVVFLRLLILAAEAGSAALLLGLLARWGRPRPRALLYLLHPLAIIELTGNLHFEAVVIFFILLAIWLLSQGKVLVSAGALGLAVASKLTPLLLLPYLIKRLGRRKFVAYSLVVGSVLALLFSVFIPAKLLLHISQSLGLYFRTFEFNASLYYLLRALGYQYQGYNEIAIIGPALGAVAALALLGLAWREKATTLAGLPAVLLLAFTIYYLCATIVHPWYLTPLLALSVFTNFRYALLWGGLAVLSYAAYRTPAFQENFWLLGLEYGLSLGLLLYELRRDGAGHSPAA
ncbi:DUF2029 domain-containing protein [Hymenobacter saemangeumensis]|uniref:DUF2029 domain-containing protein n=1 Tax=Hymenobacter saemangeumensis TaxID=1084522 RepID=A0ABP8IKI8_9BACT